MHLKAVWKCEWLFAFETTLAYIFPASICMIAYVQNNCIASHLCEFFNASSGGGIF